MTEDSDYASQLERERALRYEKLKRTNKKLYWAFKFHRNTRGEAMSFTKAKFLIPLYNALNTDREVCFEKSVQSGISESLIVSHLEEASRGLAVLYTLPTTELRNTFVQQRINRLIQDVPLYDRILHETTGAKADSVIQKHFGRGVLRYVSSDGEASFKSFPADAVYLDEKDEMDQTAIGRARDRLQSSKHRLYRVVANPTIENYGIDIDWNESSQATWHVSCPHCTDWQPFDWFENVVRRIDDDRYESRDKGWANDPMLQHRVFCRKCGKELDRFSDGEYVHAYPKREKRGYRINKIFGAQHVPLRETVAEFLKALGNESDLQLFYNSSLGLPYTAKGSKITKDDLDACIVESYHCPKGNEGSGAVMGVDVGKVLHVVVRKVVAQKGERPFCLPLLWVGTLQNEQELHRVYQRFRVKSAVIDALPELRMVERAQALMPNLWACHFQVNAKYPQLNAKHKVLSVNRTTALDRTQEAVRAKQFVNPTLLKDVDDYYAHMQNNVRVVNRTNGAFEWRKVGDDHYLLSESYGLQAADMLASRNLFSMYEEEEDARQEAAGKSREEAIADIARKHGIPEELIGTLSQTLPIE